MARHHCFTHIHTVTDLIMALRATGPLWMCLLEWRAVFWLNVHFNHAASHGGSAQQRRIARHLASNLLSEAVSQIAQSIGAKVSTPDELIAAVWDFKKTGQTPAKPPASKNAYLEPMISPAHGTRIPMIALRESSYRPRHMTLRFPARCLACKKPISIGEKIQWARGIGVCHTTCEWPLANDLSQAGRPTGLAFQSRCKSALISH